jgi:hypothetical protein
MQMRRRLTKRLSKAGEPSAAVALWIACTISAVFTKGLRCTPAMALGVTDHIWTIAELVQAALEPSDVPPLPHPTPETTLRLGYRPFRPRVIQGGKMTKFR